MRMFHSHGGAAQFAALGFVGASSKLAQHSECLRCSLNLFHLDHPLKASPLALPGSIHSVAADGENLPDRPRPAVTYSAAEPIAEVAPAVSEFSQAVLAAQMQFQRDISRSRFRQKIWISLVAAEIAFLAFAIVKFA